MDKFIAKAEEILTGLQNLENTHILSFEHDPDCMDLMLDAQILCFEFGCEPIYKALLEATHPNEHAIRQCLLKLIETAQFRKL